MESNKQTAVEWLVQHWKKLQSKGEKMSWNQIIQITELAKEMEKEQIKDAYDQGDIQLVNGKQYYEQTYGGNNE
jgi:hypothetical protein